MSSETKKRIKVKRIQRRRHKFRVLIRLFMFTIFFGFIGWMGYHLYDWGNRAYSSISMHPKKSESLSATKQMEGYTNILLLGVDEGTTGEKGKHVDTLLLLSMDNKQGRMRAISVPRKTMVQMPGNKLEQPISGAYEAGGEPLLSRLVSELLGVPVHQYVAVDIKAVADIVDILGGVDLYVEEDMEYEDPEINLRIHIKKGYQHLEGEQAQQYLRFRGDELGDIGRVQRQQKFLAAIYKKILSLDVMTKVPQLVELLQKRVVTSAEIFDSAQLISVIKGLSGENIQSVMIPGTLVKNSDYWRVDQQAKKERMAELFPELAVQ